MELETETFGEVVVVHAPEEVTRENGERLAGELRRPLDNGRARLVLDMERTEQIDSAGLTLLIELQDELRQRHGNVKLSAPSPTVRKVFEITRLDHRFEILESVLEAVKSYQS